MARATEEAVVKEIDKDALLGFLKYSPQTAFNMMQQLASYARNANEKLSVDAFSSGNDENDVTDENQNVKMTALSYFQFFFVQICLRSKIVDTPLVFLVKLKYYNQVKSVHNDLLIF